MEKGKASREAGCFWERRISALQGNLMYAGHVPEQWYQADILSGPKGDLNLSGYSIHIIWVSGVRLGNKYIGH